MMARFIDLGHPLHRTKQFFVSVNWLLKIAQHTDITELCETNDDLMTFVTNPDKNQICETQCVQF